MDLIHEKIGVKTDFTNAPRHINERNQKSLILLLYLPWLLNVAASISSTSRGYVLLFVPKHVEETVLRFVFQYASNEIVHIALIAFLNLLVDFTLFSILITQKNKFEIHKEKTAVILLMGHLVGAILYFIGSANQNARSIINSLTGVMFLFVPYYIVVRYVPKKYFEILSPYSVLFLSREIQKFLGKQSKPQSKQSIKAFKNRLRLYVCAFLLLLIKSDAEKDAVVLVKKWKDVDCQDGKEIAVSVVKFSNYLYSAFAIQIRNSSLIFDKTEKIGLLEKAILVLDIVFSWTVYSSITFPEILDLFDKSLFSETNKGQGIVLGYENKSVVKIIKYHLSRANEADVLSAKQKIYALIVVTFVYLIPPTLIYMISAKDESGSLSQAYHLIILMGQYVATFGATYFSIYLIREKFRSVGVNMFVSNRFVGYLGNGIVLLAFFVPATMNDKVLYRYIPQLFPQNLNMFIVGIAILQVFLLFITIKPPVELKKSRIATSLLVRELLLLRAQVSERQGIKGRRQMSRYIYFSKKYFNYIVRDLINSRFDSQSQKSQLRDHFSTINEYLDNLSSNIKLGTMQNRENVISQIDMLVYLVSLEEFGEIPNMIPEIKTHLELKGVRPSAPSFISRVFQILDTSWLLRLLVLIVITVIINLLNPSLWEYLQNLSSLFGLLPP